jgi:hypothetical protein
MSGEQAVTTPLENIPAYVETVRKNLSPYDLPPADDKPMRQLLTELIDFDRLRSQQEAPRQSRLAIHNRQRPRQAEETVPSVRVTRATSPIMERFPLSSKLNNYPPLLEYLFNLGRQTADAWIAQNGDTLGQRSTMDVQQLLPGSIWDNI